jgi:hypothetical protein
MRTRVAFTAAGLAVVLGVAVLPAAAFAQDPSQEYGMKAGVNFSTLTFTDADPRSVDDGRRAGLVAGVYLTRSVWRALGVQGEALLSLKGTDAGDTSLRVTYFEVPLLGRIDFDAPIEAPIHVVFGPSLGFKLDASQSAPLFSDDVGTDIENFDIGWLAGAGVTLDSFVIEGRYTWGFLNVPRGVLVDEPRIRNETFAIMVSLRLGGR